jgi:hypothetical protein
MVNLMDRRSTRLWMKMVLTNGGNPFSAREGSHNGAKFDQTSATHLLRPGGRPAFAEGKRRISQYGAKLVFVRNQPCRHNGHFYMVG